MSIKIKDLPEGERPYEKLEERGAKFLTNSELLAIIIKISYFRRVNGNKRNRKSKSDTIKSNM